MLKKLYLPERSEAGPGAAAGRLAEVGRDGSLAGLPRDPRVRRAFLKEVTAQEDGGRLLMTGQIGIYELGPLLGSGGMGEVYRARDTELGREVAIKILPAHFVSDPERRAD